MAIKPIDGFDMSLGIPHMETRNKLNEVILTLNKLSEGQRRHEKDQPQACEHDYRESYNGKTKVCKKCNRDYGRTP